MISGTKIKASLIGLFFVGFVLGAVVDRYYWLRSERPSGRRESGRENPPPRPIDMLKEQLQLRPEQAQKVEAILNEAGEEYMRLRSQIRPQFDEIRNRQQAQIQALLDPPQREAYQKLIQEWEHRRRPDEKRPK